MSESVCVYVYVFFFSFGSEEARPHATDADEAGRTDPYGYGLVTLVWHLSSPTPAYRAYLATLQTYGRIGEDDAVSTFPHNSSSFVNITLIYIFEGVFYCYGFAGEFLFFFFFSCVLVWGTNDRTRSI